MSGELIGILGGLVGSTMTVIITKFLEIVQQKNEFSFELKKQFFSKKLQAAEAAIMQYSHFSEALNQLSILYSRYRESDSNVGQDLTNNFLKQIDDKIALANSSSLALSNAIGLYFDLQSNFTSNQILTHFYDSLNMLAPYTENVEFTHDQYLRNIGGNQEAEAYQIYIDAENNLDQAMKKVGEEYKIADTELRNQMHQIRNSMRKYE
ncbi:hypothetical protein [Limnovirga soli]|uniref:Uncharacterized protein n=1 Tax=Limnovirga soli TaxID=2656915 RepID=A0A8J8FJ95_9BACT|nr:hypothetical protein [Limnovirga soli]NNV57344.1 hypothetical protein [Limnovirga soli]